MTKELNIEPIVWAYYDDWNKLKLAQTMPPDPNMFPLYPKSAIDLLQARIAELEKDITAAKCLASIDMKTKIAQQAEIEALKSNAESMGQTNKAMGERLLDQQAEIDKLKAFVQPILVHGDAGIGDWDGLELQELAVKAGLLNPVTRTGPCNIGNEELQGCACREFCYGEKEWECNRIAGFLLEG